VHAQKKSGIRGMWLKVFVEKKMSLSKFRAWKSLSNCAVETNCLRGSNVEFDDDEAHKQRTGNVEPE